ncbi:transposase [Streptomyces sp. P9-A2]|uniref:transposase n=1 Tax=Streptomyces sp. P9-A2 TaxID=3072284 RepID=UPI002FC6504C
MSVTPRTWTAVGWPSPPPRGPTSCRTRSRADGQLLLDLGLRYVHFAAQGTGDGGELVEGGLEVADDLLGRTWGENGRTPVVRRSGKRFSVNAISAISPKGRMHFMVFTESCTAEVTCRFPDRLAGHFGQAVPIPTRPRAPHRGGTLGPRCSSMPEYAPCQTPLTVDDEE